MALTLLLGCGCQALMSVDAAGDNAFMMAQEAGLTPAVERAQPFRLQTFSRNLDSPSDELTIFIEGDGRAWRGRRRPPRNPTPTNPVALRLATLDRSPAVLYMARPCQFIDSPGACDGGVWTSHRYGESVVSAMNRVLDRIQSERQRRLVLVGHSGGGVVAALLASRRTDVVALYTLAAPLSVASWTGAADLTPLQESLDPAQLAPLPARTLARIPQWHYLGAGDDVVPRQALDDYLNNLPRPHRARVVVLDGVDHGCCWAALWPGLRSGGH